jgi:hypothetical protein
MLAGFLLEALETAAGKRRRSSAARFMRMKCLVTPAIAHACPGDHLIAIREMAGYT